MTDRKNIPYVKAYDASGELINPILFSYRGYGPNRKERREKEGKTSKRPFSNKKGIQLAIVRVGPYSFMKFEKKLIKQGESDTRLQYLERKKVN
jgi:hypothetical protein